LVHGIHKGAEPYYIQTEAVSADKIPPANRDVGGNRPLTAALEATRGCPVGCEFCAVSHRKGGNFWGRATDSFNCCCSSKRRDLYFLMNHHLILIIHQRLKVARIIKELSEKKKLLVV
jgi:radical SAM superfamily enzyme YgiQ (UPF0313 family)